MFCTVIAVTAALDTVHTHLEQARNRAMEEGRPYRFSIQENARAFKVEPDDTANLHTEAAVRRLVGKGRRSPPIGLHVSTHSPQLLRGFLGVREIYTSGTFTHASL